MTSASSTREAYAFRPVIAVRKGRNAIHLSQQAGTWVTAPLFVSTLCGRPITNNDGWIEVREAATCQRCEQECANIDSARAYVIEEDHAAALAEDAERRAADTLPEYVCADWEGGELGTRHYITRVNGTDSGDYFRPTDGARWSENPYAPGAEFPGSHGGAQTYCGRIGYGVIYRTDEGPAVDCADCLAARATDDVVANVTPEEDEDMDSAFRRCGQCGGWMDGAHGYGPCPNVSASRELTESEYDEIASALRTAVIAVCDRFGLVAGFDACDRIANDATNALSRHGIRR